MAASRLVGAYPVIGIRPTIDGRRGALDVRGSLEEQTMNMAKAAAKLFEENLRYSNGEPVKVVIADTTIGRVGETAACAEKFRREGVDITVTVTPCWCWIPTKNHFTVPGLSTGKEKSMILSNIPFQARGERIRNHGYGSSYHQGCLGI